MHFEECQMQFDLTSPLAVRSISQELREESGT